MENKSTGRRSWIYVLVVVSLFCAVAYLVAWRITQRDSVNLSTAIPLPCTSDQNVQVFGDGVMYYDGNHLHALDGSGKQRWPYLVGPGADYQVDEGGVAAWAGTLLTVLSSSGEPLYSGNLEKSVLSARVGSQYVAALVGEEHDGVLLVLEREGRQVERIELPDVTVLDYGFFSGGQMLWVMTLDTEGTVPMSSISTYRPGKMLTGTISDAEQVDYQVLFQATRIRTVGTTHIKTYDYTGQEDVSSRQLVYGWYLLDINESGESPSMVFVPTAQADGVPTIQDVRLIKGDRDQTVRMPFTCFTALAGQDAVYGFTEQYAVVCRLGEKKPAVYTLPVYASDVLGLTNNHQAVVVSSDAVYMVPLP